MAKSLKTKTDPEIIQRFQDLIKERNLNQIELAKELGFSRTYLSSILTGRSDFSGAFIRALYEKNWPVNFIMTGQTETADAIKWKERALKAEEKLKLLEHYVMRLENLVKK